MIVGPDGLLGDNTDGYGFMASLAAGAPGWRADAGPAVLLGAGGAARAIAVALIDAGAPELRLVNRTLARAEALAGQLADAARERGAALTVLPWQEQRALAGAALLVNTTSLGMRGQPPLEIDLARAAGAQRWSPTSSTARSRPACWRRRGRAATPWSTAWACCCTRRGPAFAPGSGSIPRSPMRCARRCWRGSAEMFVLGLTGSIGMGKSTASAGFRCFGIPVFDSDAAVHALFAPGGAAVAAVDAAFPGCLDAPAASIARALGRKVFDDPAALARLEAIVHPLVRAAQRRFLACCCARRPARWWCSTSRCCTRPAASGWSMRWRWSAPGRSCRRSACCGGRA